MSAKKIVFDHEALETIKDEMWLFKRALVLPLLQRMG